MPLKWWESEMSDACNVINSSTLFLNALPDVCIYEEHVYIYLSLDTRSIFYLNSK